MPPPQATYLTRSSNTGYDPATLSDDEDDATETASSSAWSASAASTGLTTLAVLDGAIPSENVHEHRDWKISRVGGEPSFPLSAAPPVESRLCLTCSTPMPLVVQLYCPLPHSTLERVVYVFACPRPACQKARVPRGSAGDGPACIRAWRANGVWREAEAVKLREREEREKREQEERERIERRDAASKVQLGGLVFGGGAAATSSSANPFAVPPPSGTASSTFNPFSMPALPAAAPASNPFAPATAPPTSTTAAAPNPFAPPAPTAAPAELQAAPIAMSDEGAADQVISTWPPVASTSASSATPMPVFPPQYVATLYEPAPSAAAAGSASKGGKGKSREDELARAFDAEPALPNREDTPTTAASGVTKPKKPDVDGSDDYHYLEEEEEEQGRARPGKGAGGRVKKGADRAASKKLSAGNGGGGGGGDLAGEGYEVQRVKGVDDVFLRFQERVSREGRQIVRYDYGAAPLPYSSSSGAYKLLHPPVASNSDVGTYAPARVPPCRSCRAGSAFELQLMPHLAHGLDERYEWASVWVLSCTDECPGGAGAGGAGAEGEAWREERVLVEWEDEGA
ncbi:hypothetical protein JCM3774_006729 [Rhodotorula dairenensis]